jgi:hypothetical protein
MSNEGASFVKNPGLDFSKTTEDHSGGAGNKKPAEQTKEDGGAVVESSHSYPFGAGGADVFCGGSE